MSVCLCCNWHCTCVVELSVGDDHLHQLHHQDGEEEEECGEWRDDQDKENQENQKVWGEGKPYLCCKFVQKPCLFGVSFNKFNMLC